MSWPHSLHLFLKMGNWRCRFWCHIILSCWVELWCIKAIHWHECLRVCIAKSWFRSVNNGLKGALLHFLLSFESPWCWSFNFLLLLLIQQIIPALGLSSRPMGLVKYCIELFLRHIRAQFEKFVYFNSTKHFLQKIWKILANFLFPTVKQKNQEGVVYHSTRNPLLKVVCLSWNEQKPDLSCSGANCQLVEAVTEFTKHQSWLAWLATASDSLLNRLLER